MNRLLCLALACLLAGCASVSVKKGTSSAAGKPEKIYVADFSTAEGAWKVDRTGTELAAFQKSLQDILAAKLVENFSRQLVPASRGGKAEAPAGQPVWLVTGKFTHVDQGSRLLRAAVGFGSGRTTIETEVAVYDLRQGPPVHPFLTFSTTGGSGAEPGAVLGGDPLGVATSAAGGAAHGLSEDAGRTAREVTAVLSDYMYDHGWTPSGKRLQPKYRSN